MGEGIAVRTGVLRALASWRQSARLRGAGRRPGLEGRGAPGREGRQREGGADREGDSRLQLQQEGGAHGRDRREGPFRVLRLCQRRLGHGRLRARLRDLQDSRPPLGAVADPADGDQARAMRRRRAGGTRAAAPSPRTSKAEVIPLLEHGNALLEQKDYAGARAEYEKALVLVPDNPIILRAIARTYYSEKNYDQAIATLKKAVEKDPAGQRHAAPAREPAAREGRHYRGQGPARQDSGREHQGPRRLFERRDRAVE